MKKLFAVLLILVSILAITAAMAEDLNPVTSGDYQYFLLEDGTAEIVGYNGSEEYLTLLSELDGHSVTASGWL